MPLLTASLIELIIMAEIDDLFMPFTRQLVMGHKVMKSPYSGEMCIVQPLLRRNGKDERETSGMQDEEAMGDMEMPEMSTVEDLVVQSMEALRLL